MKSLAIAAIALLATVASVSAEHCIDMEKGSTDPSIAASKRKGHLYVKLNHATKLTDKDTFGENDPFVEMWLDKSYKQRSKDTKGVNPRFNETFCFYVRPGQDRLYVKAVDRDTLRNDKIGEATIPLSNVFQTGREGPKDYKLPKWLGFSDNGSVNMQM
ncbi:hypothetical protein BGZ94_004720, partial [Podila epigama]